MISVEVTWDGKKDFENLIRYIDNIPFVRLEAEVANLADNMVEDMKGRIDALKRNPDRPDLKLENALDWEEVVNIPGKELVVGIGNIDKLRNEAPHWELIDVGGTYITKATHIVPTTYFTDPGDGFVIFKAGSVHTINGIDYVGHMLKELEKDLNKRVVEFGGIVLEGMKNSSENGKQWWGSKVDFNPEGFKGSSQHTYGGK